MSPAEAPGAHPGETGPAAFAELTPDQVLDALQAVGLHGDGRILQLNSYENRVFQVMLEDGRAVVAKFYRPGRWSDEQILEEHAFSHELAAEEVPVVAPLALRAEGVSDAHGATGSAGLCQPAAYGSSTLAAHALPHGTLRYAVWPRHAGRTPDLEDPAVLERLGAFIGRLHAGGRRGRFAARPTMCPAADAAGWLGEVLEEGFVPPDQARTWRAACEEAIARIGEAFDRVSPALLRLHGDCHRGNLLWRDEGAHIVDLDDACNGPAVQDLWMLLSGEPVAAGGQLRSLLAGYERFGDFDDRELGLIAPLRLLRVMRHNAWVARRWGDPAFPRAYPDFGSSGYWAQQSMQLRELLAD